MRDQRVSNSELARRLGLHERVIRRMLDPEHAAKAEKIQAALAVLGKQMTVEVRDAACRRPRILTNRPPAAPRNPAAIVPALPVPQLSPNCASAACPRTDGFALPLTGRDGVQPPVNEEAELGLAEPRHLGVLRGGLGQRRLAGLGTEARGETEADSDEASRPWGHKLSFPITLKYHAFPSQDSRFLKGSVDPSEGGRARAGPAPFRWPRPRERRLAPSTERSRRRPENATGAGGLCGTARELRSRSCPPPGRRPIPAGPPSVRRRPRSGAGGPPPSRAPPRRGSVR